MSLKGPRRPPPRPRHFEVELKIFVTPAMFAALVVEAREREWSVPQVIRWCVREAQAEKLL